MHIAITTRDTPPPPQTNSIAGIIREGEREKGRKTKNIVPANEEITLSPVSDDGRDIGLKPKKCIGVTVPVENLEKLSPSARAWAMVRRVCVTVTAGLTQTAKMEGE